MSEKLYIHGFNINNSTPSLALEEVDTVISSGGHGYVCFCEANLFVHAINSPELKEILNQASLVYPDGIAIKYMADFRHGKQLERVPGPSFILDAANYGQKKKWRHFFYGGADGVAGALAVKLQEIYPDMIVAGTYSPPFRKLNEQEELHLKQIIDDTAPDLLWVGLGGPKQEMWMHQHLHKIDVPVMLGVGAAFDFHSGTRPWAPEWIRKIGLEWLFRALTGGRRTFFRNLKCVFVTGCILSLDFIRYKLLVGKARDA